MPASHDEIIDRARAELERGRVSEVIRGLDQARSELLASADLEGLMKVLWFAREIAPTTPEELNDHSRLIEALEEDVREIGRKIEGRPVSEWDEDSSSAELFPPQHVENVRGESERTDGTPLSNRIFGKSRVGFAARILFTCGLLLLFIFGCNPQGQLRSFECRHGLAGSPAWSPDGRSIAFAMRGRCGTQIMIIYMKGGKVRPLTDGFGEEPAWSPSGQKILFTSKRGFSSIPSDGGAYALIRADDSDMGAAWSPDGTQIAFTHGLTHGVKMALSDSRYRSTLYVMGSDGTNIRRLVGHSCNPGTPAWSPDGHNLAFECSSGVYILTLESGSLRCIRPYYIRSSHHPPHTPSWAPDGRSLAVVGDSAIVIVTMSGASRSVSTDSIQPRDVAWSPGGDLLTFSGSPDGGNGAASNLYLIGVDGYGLRAIARLGSS